MTEKELYAIEPIIDRLVSDKPLMDAIVAIADEETRVVKACAISMLQSKTPITQQTMIDQQRLIGQIDGIENFLAALTKVVVKYRTRKTSAEG